MKKVLPYFYQHVDFATRETNTLDHVYTNIKGAFKASPCPHLGSSDHISVMLTPAYRPLLVRTKPSLKQVRVWPEGPMSCLCRPALNALTGLSSEMLLPKAIPQTSRSMLILYQDTYSSAWMMSVSKKHYSPGEPETMDDDRGPSPA